MGVPAREGFRISNFGFVPTHLSFTRVEGWHS